ncbi:hypothetical protein AA0474_3049 [Acetobacter lovaniensis NRIC 0474]|nr:hypothetical protein AA0474_3049 [Acetobacter lovaniensis NRIC 0474]
MPQTGPTSVVFVQRVTDIPETLPTQRPAIQKHLSPQAGGGEVFAKNSVCKRVILLCNPH